MGGTKISKKHTKGNETIYNVTKNDDWSGAPFCECRPVLRESFVWGGTNSWTTRPVLRGAPFSECPVMRALTVANIEKINFPLQPKIKLEAQISYFFVNFSLKVAYEFLGSKYWFVGHYRDCLMMNSLLSLVP